MRNLVKLRRLPQDAIGWPSRHESRPDVAPLVERVRAEGDSAVAALAAEFGDPPPREVAASEWRTAYEQLEPVLRDALNAAAERIERFARAQRSALTDVTLEAEGLELAQRVVPLESVGVYVPAGRHPLPTSLLMTAIPARVAGVGSITVCSPRAARETLAAAHLAGVDRLFEIGGAQAIAALAFGTASVPKVDLIAGPGNAYVTAAKREVYGVCGIDALAGPSELIVIAARDADAALVAADLLAQAEHDAEARVMLLSDSEAFVSAVEVELDEQLDTLETKLTAASAIALNGSAAIVPLEAAIAVANKLAPEHLELIGRRAETLAPAAQHYGALFVGAQTGAVFGDYGAGPNHVLPTDGTARFSSGLSVYNFLAIRTYQRATGPLDRTLRTQAASLADCEGLVAHRNAAMRRETSA